jgi:hypothetical protein
MATLGCPSITVTATDRGGARSLGTLPTIDGGFSRRLSAVSDAQVTVDTAGCADVLALVRSGRSELAFFDGERLAWAGPIRDAIDDPDGRTSIDADDVAAWVYDGRDVHNDHVLVSEDLTRIYEIVVNDALAPDDPGNITLDVTPCGVLGDRTVLAVDATPASGVLDELARTAFDWTVYGRRWMVNAALGPLPDLTDEHFTRLRVTDSRSRLATKVTVKGEAVTGVAGGVDPYYGLIERTRSEPAIKDQASVDRAAASELSQRAIPFVIDSSEPLRPTAPVSLAELIPGRRVRVVTEFRAKPLSIAMVLTEVRCTVAGAVTVGLAPLGDR